MEKYKMNDFSFKKFSITQQRSAMRVNTDAVLLGAWMSIPNKNNIKALDVGTGTGVIAIMLAQRAVEKNISAKITAIDICSSSCLDARENFNCINWQNIEFSLLLTPFQELAQSLPKSQKFDLIFSNPPFFINSLKSPDKDKSCARHTDTLSQADIILHSTNLLSENGLLCLILPSAEAQEFIRKTDFLQKTAQKTNTDCLNLQRICKIKTTAGKAAKRFLMEFRYAKATAQQQPIEESIIMMEKGEYTQQYKNLVSDFYLNM